jgi:Subtilase family
MRRVAARWPWAPALALAALLALGGSSPASGTGEGAAPAPAPSAVLAELAQAVGGRGASRQPQRFAYLHELDSHLQEIAVSRLVAGEAAAALEAERQGATVSPAGDVSVDVYVQGDVARAADELRALGMQVVAVSDRAPQRMVEGFLPADALAQAAALAATRALITPFSRLASGSALSEGDAAIHGPQARAFGPNGAGVAVGIISDSINADGGLAASQAAGDLPADVQILSDMAGGTDEGRAMAEIVYDEAPALSRIVFASAAGGAAVKANTIDSLVASGVRVIADDTSYITEPFFQDDVIAQAVDRARAAGVAYFISAGNDGSQSWEGTYNGGSSHDFDPGAGIDTVQRVVTLPAGRTATFVLQWAEPWGGAVTNFALDVYRSNGGGALQYFGTVDTNNLTSGIPMEATSFSGGGTRTWGIAIRRTAGAGAPLLKYIAYTNGTPTSIEYATNSGAIGPDAASATGAFTVSASHFSTPTAPEPFSSRGPVVRRFAANGSPLAVPDVRQKPTLGGPDGVTTSLDDFSPFYGTSAAAPAVAGIAALMLSAKPALSVEALYAIMTNPVNALDCPAAGSPDIDCGAGFLLADRALGVALDSTPPVIAPVVSPAAPDGANGWYRAPVSVSWSVSDAESPVFSPAGCAAASPGEGTTALTCSAASAGGGTAVPLTIKRDATPPSRPVFTRIAARTYSPKTLPPASRVGCTATDPTSGVARCAITGYRSAPGRHTLTATATNNAGLTATATLAYKVVKPAAISRLALARGLTLAKVAQAGVPATVRVAAGATRIVAKLVARVPKAVGKGMRTIELAALSKRVPSGTAKLRITLPAKAKRRLLGLAEATLTVTVTASAKQAKTKLLQRSAVVPRA